MRNVIILAAGLLLSCTSLAGKDYRLSTPSVSLCVRADEGRPAEILYFGAELNESDFSNLPSTGMRAWEAYPVFGMNAPSEAALSVRHHDGNLTTRLAVQTVEQGADESSSWLRIHMKDEVYPFYVILNYKAYKDVDMIETWTEIRNQEKKPIVLNEFHSAYLPVRKGNVHISHLYGSWANEGILCMEKLCPGVKTIKNKDGVRNSHTAHAEVMLSLDGEPQENAGRIIGAALCYSGNYELKIDTDDSDYHHFFTGINPDNSSYTLAKGEVFVTPVLALTYSSEGLSGASRNFHKWGRKYKLAHGDMERKILLNSWEGVYFDIKEPGMHQMMSDIASMGGELFVMDDGWFGGKYPRDDDKTSLGDWCVDADKLPAGIAGLVAAAEERGVDFGIWIEPEMTNTASELYAEHPEWVLKAPEREPVVGRGGTQLVLDLSNPEVQDFVVKVVDDIMAAAPGIDYIKWDANMAVMNYGSQYLPVDKQSHLYIEYHRGFASVCERIRAKYPNLTIQACASGGGRANWGVLPWFDEFWVSDNTDALQRIRMQWGTSYFFPAIAMASHISAAPNHQTFRTIPIKFRADVAMSGRLGMEIQPKNMTEDETAVCRQAIADYKKVRHIVQFGDIYRLDSPYDDNDVASMMYCAEDKSEAVFYWWKQETYCNAHLPMALFAGLDPEKTYVIKELNRIDNEPLSFEGKTFTGSYLMSVGLELPQKHIVDYHEQNDWASRVLYLMEKK